MKQPLWVPSEERIKNSNMTRFMGYVNRRFHKEFTGYFDLYDWSVKNISDFWASVWDFLEIKASRKKVKGDIHVRPGKVV